MVQVAPTVQELSLVAVENEHAVTTSLRVAEVFGKEHYNVMKAIKSLDCSEEFRAVNFNASKIAYQNGNIKSSCQCITLPVMASCFLLWVLPERRQRSGKRLTSRRSTKWRLR